MNLKNTYDNSAAINLDDGKKLRVSYGANL